MAKSIAREEKSKSFDRIVAKEMDDVTINSSLVTLFERQHREGVVAEKIDGAVEELKAYSGSCSDEKVGELASAIEVNLKLLHASIDHNRAIIKHIMMASQVDDNLRREDYAEYVREAKKARLLDSDDCAKVLSNSDSDCDSE